MISNRSVTSEPSKFQKWEEKFQRKIPIQKFSITKIDLRKLGFYKYITNIRKMSPRIINCHQLQVTNITISPTSLSPLFYFSVQLFHQVDDINKTRTLKISFQFYGSLSRPSNPDRPTGLKHIICIQILYTQKSACSQQYFKIL